jgi:hypothetical protein
LCEEFGFSEFSAKLSEFRPSTGFQEPADADSRGRIAALEERAEQHDRDIAVLQDKFKRLSTDFGRLAGEVSALRSAAAGTQSLSGGGSALQTQTAAMRSTPPSVANHPVPPLRSRIRSSLQKPSLPFNSRIISDFPEIFAEFRGMRFELLWRGSRDGFGAQEFHRRCDGRANTLTVILDKKGNVFGGFTPVEWESRKSNWLKADASQESFVFTLKNPHNVPARRFPLKAEKKQRAIYCDSRWGPRFEGGIAASNNCNANTDSYTDCFGSNYTNDTGLAHQTFFTGSEHFRVKEIEVFEIAD